MTNKNSNQNTSNFGRRTWDLDYYQKKSEESKKRKLENEEGSRKKRIISIDHALETRTESITSGITFGKRKLISNSDDLSIDALDNVKKKVEDSISIKISRSPFYCQLCNKEYRDNHSYIEHLNSEQHIHASGMMMRAKKSTLDDVLEKLKQSPSSNLKVDKTKINKESQNLILEHVGQTLKKKQLSYEERLEQKQLELKKKEEERIEKIKTKDAIKSVSITRGKQEKQLQKLLGFQSFGK